MSTQYPIYACRVFLILVFFSGLTGESSSLGQTNPSVNLSNSLDPKFDAYVEQFLIDIFAAQPDFAVWQGRHEFDGQLPDWSPDALKRESQRLRSERERLLAFKEIELDERRRFERNYLLAEIESMLYWLDISEGPYRNPSFYGGALDPDVYVSREYAPLEVRIRSFTKYALNVPRALQQVRANLHLPLDKTMIKIGRRTIGGLADFYAKDVVTVFAPVKDEVLQREFHEANDRAIIAVKEFDTWLASQESSATDDYALGAQKFSLMLKMTEQIEIPLDELETIGMRDLKHNQDELRIACEKFAPGKTIAQCMTLAASHKPKDLDPIVSATKQLSLLRQFVVDNDIVTIPGTEQATVKLSPAYKSWNSAYINIPGPYEKNLPSIYYISPPDPTWSKEVQDAYLPSEAELMNNSVHEVYPGHFVQYLHVNRVVSKVGQVFASYAFTEGWAHYCEEMMYDAGLGSSDPEVRIAQLKDALLRNVRFLVSIRMHTKGMTIEQAKQMFITDAYQDPGNAEQQAERGTFDAAYLNYTLGKLMIRKLRDDWTATRGGRKAWKEFHDEFLKFGGPPIPMIRRAMMGADEKGSLF